MIHGQIYIAGLSSSPINPDQGYVSVYAPNPCLNAVPPRTISLSDYPSSCRQTLRVACAHSNNESGTSTRALYVYSATASGAAAPLCALGLTNIDFVQDIAAAGNIYQRLTTNNGASPSIRLRRPVHPRPARIINFGICQVWGVAVDPKGDVFVDVCQGRDNAQNLAIEEFAPGASGADALINPIVSLDGNYSTSIQVFAPTASGNQAPALDNDIGQTVTPFFAVNQPHDP